MVLGSYYVQAQVFSLRPVLASVPVAVLIALVLYINEFPDREGDRSVGKNNLVVTLGKKKAVVFYHAMLACAYLSIALLAASKILPAVCLVSFLSLPLAFKAFRVSADNFQKIYELLPANAATIALHSAIGILLSAGFIVDKIFFLKQAI